MCLAAKAFWSHLAAAWLFVADGFFFFCEVVTSPVVALLSEIQLKRTETSDMSVLHTIVQLKVGTSFVLFFILNVITVFLCSEIYEN